jgi:hypothetical protein
LRLLAGLRLFIGLLLRTALLLLCDTVLLAHLKASLSGLGLQGRFRLLLNSRKPGG